MGKENPVTYELWLDFYELVNCDDLYDMHDEPTSIVTVQGFLNGKYTAKKKAIK